jgi:UDP-2,3-diacylglucosamine hydrolase
MTTLFISDLHLDESRPDISAQFKQFLNGPATHASSLYILGDLFEAWIGDDDENPVADWVAEGLNALAERGVKTYFMAGNRDFLVGPAYLERAGCELLMEPLVIELYGQRVLVLHGDSLCTDDHQYMAFRSLVRNPAWQAEFLAKPLPARRAMAEQARLVSKTTTAEKPPEIMDVNAEAVAAVMAEHRVDLLLHGHTHRPNIHRFDLPAGPATRIVLGDWYTQGSTLSWDENGYQLQSLPRS